MLNKFPDRFDEVNNTAIKLTDNKLELLPDTLERTIAIKNSDKQHFFVHHKRKAKYVYDSEGRLLCFAFYVHNKDIELLKSDSKGFFGDEITFTQGIGLYSALSKETRRYMKGYFEEHEGRLPKKRPHSTIRYHNQQAWDAMPIGKVFHAIDLDNCWFQMANRMHIISDKTYKTWIEQDEFQPVLQRFLPMLSSPVNVDIYKDGELISNDTDIYTKGYNVLYNNVRAEAASIITKAMKSIGDDSVIYANTDEIGMVSDKRKIVADLFRSMNLEFKCTLCKKLSRYTYYYGGATKYWKGKNSAMASIKKEVKEFLV